MGLLNTRQWFASGQSGDSPFGENIGQSLRFRGASRLLRTTTAAITGDWTISFWFKQECVMTRASGSDNYYFMFGNYLATLNLYTNNNNSAPASNGVLGNQQLNYAFAGEIRDPAAWYHCVMNKENGVTRGWINGVGPGFAYNGSDLTIADANTLAIGANSLDPGQQPSNVNSMKGYMADWYFIDGQALQPTAFGRFNEDGVWVPRATADFTAAGVWWSDWLTATIGTIDSGQGGSILAFNGNLEDGPGRVFTSAGGQLTWAPEVDATFQSTLEIYNTNSAGQQNITWNGNTAQPNGGWVTVATGSGTISEATPLVITATSGANRAELYAVRLDGEIVLDPFQWSAGLTWSSAAGGYQSNTANRTATGLISPNQAFDGNLVGQCQAPGGATWLYWNPQEAIPCTTVQLIVNNDLDQTPSDAYINGTQVSPLPTPVLNGSNYYVSFEVPGGSLTEFAFANQGGPNTSIFGMSVNNGNILVNGANNSYGSQGFHLDFADRSQIGKDVSGNNNNFTNQGFNFDPVGVFSDMLFTDATFTADAVPNLTTTDKNFGGAGPATGAFDGSLATGAFAAGTGTALVWRPDPEIRNVETLTVDIGGNMLAGSVLGFNGNTQLTPVPNGSHTIYDNPGNPITLENVFVTSSGNAQIDAIIVNGTILVDNIGEDYDLMQDSPSQNYSLLNGVTPVGAGAVVDPSDALLTLRGATGITIGEKPPGKTIYFEINTGYVNNGGAWGNWWNLIQILNGQTQTISGGGNNVAPQSMLDNGGFAFDISANIFANNVDQAVAISSTNLAANDIIGVELTDTNITVYINGVVSSGINNLAFANSFADGMYIYARNASNAGNPSEFLHINFGQKPFLFRPSSLTDANNLQTQNLAAATIPNGTDHFRALTAPGPSILSVAQGNVNGFFDASGFNSGMWWIKDMDLSQQHQIGNTLTGRDTIIFCPTSPNAMDDSPYIPPIGDSVAWCWKAENTFTPVGANGVTNLSGLRNTDAGFSIVTASTAGSANATYTHGLTGTPQFIMAKCRTNAFNWICYHEGLTGAPTTTRFLNLNADSAEQNNSALMFDVSTAGQVVLGQNAGINLAGNDYVYYNWTSIPGYSAIGTFPGNGSADGPFVYTGFKPAFVMIKSLTTGFDWFIWDTTRNIDNPCEEVLKPSSNQNEADASSTVQTLQVLSNGFKINGDNQVNQPNSTSAYVAFAENPFGGSNIPPNTAALFGPPQINGITQGIGKSLRFKSADNARLTRTMTTNGGSTWTWSAWIKKGDEDTRDELIFGTASPLQFHFIRNNIFTVTQSTVQANDGHQRRDPNAWYHRVDVSDGTTIKMYINGVETVSWTQASVGVNTNVEHFFGGEPNRLSEYFEGYLADAYFIDGEALTPTTFGELNSDNVWVPIADPTITSYGDNGFKLVFDPAFQSGNILLDQSGNENNWTMANFDTDDYFDANFDWMKDGPAQNYATLNSLVEEGWNPNGGGNIPAEYTGSNLFMGNSSGSAPSLSQAGQYIENIYFEIGPTLDANQRNYPGIIGYNIDYSPTDTTTVGNFNVLNTGELRSPGQATTQVFTPWFQNDTVRVRYTASTRVLEMAVNDGNWVSSNLSAFVPAGTRIGFGLQAFNNDGRGTINFGQQPFDYEVPTGFQAAVTSNYPAAAITNGRDQFQVLYGPADASGMMWREDTVNNNNPTAPLALSRQLGPWNGSATYLDGSGNASFTCVLNTPQSTFEWTLPNGFDSGAVMYVSEDGYTWRNYNDQNLYPPATTTPWPDLTNFTVNDGTPIKYVRWMAADPAGGLNCGLQNPNASTGILGAAQSLFPTGLWAIKSTTNSSTMQFVDSVTNAATGQTNASLCPRANNTEGSGFTTYAAPAGNALAFCWNYNAADPTVNGFAITRYTGNGTGTQAHNLGAEPDVIWVGCRSGVTDTDVGMSVFFRNNLQNTTNTDTSLARTTVPTAPANATNGAINTATNTTITYTGSGAGRDAVNTNGEDYTMYLWNEVAGYSKFGTYGGNASALLPFIYCGFKPACVIIMRANGGGGHWTTYNTTQDENNPAGTFFFIDDTAGSDAFSGSTKEIDILSNGFKIRTQDSDITAQNDSYLYMAWAENPFGGSNVSPVTAR